MLTHHPDADEAAPGEAFATDGEMAERVLQGELVKEPAAGRELARTACKGGIWLDRAADGAPLHHALCGYLADREVPLGTRFDRYV